MKLAGYYPRRRQIFAKGTQPAEQFCIAHYAPTEIASPSRIMFGRIEMHCLINSAMHRWVSYAVALKASLAKLHRRIHHFARGNRAVRAIVAQSPRRSH